MTDLVSERLDLFPYMGTLRERVRFLLRIATKAPSTHNTQPWIFKLSEDSVEVFADPSRALCHIDPEGREMAMSIGALTDHLRLAMVCHLMHPTIELRPDDRRPDLMVRICCTEDAVPTSAEMASFGQINLRHTYRGPFLDKPIAPETKERLTGLVNDGTAGVLFVEDDHIRSRLASMVRLRSDTLLSESEYRKEAAQWIRVGRQAEDGIPASALGMSAMAAAAAPFLLACRGLRPASSGREAQQIVEAPAVAIVCTKSDTTLDWIYAGMAVSRLTLAASGLGIRCSFFLQPIHNTEFRAELRQATRAIGDPQIVIRLGYAAEGHPTPRRSLDDTLVERIDRRQAPEGGQPK